MFVPIFDDLLILCTLATMSSHVRRVYSFAGSSPALWFPHGVILAARHMPIPELCSILSQLPLNPMLFIDFFLLEQATKQGHYYLSLNFQKSFDSFLHLYKEFWSFSLPVPSLQLKPLSTSPPSIFMSSLLCDPLSLIRVSCWSTGRR